MAEAQLHTRSEPGRFARFGLLLVGILLGQAILYGPALIGRKILLPLDILAGRDIYLPQTPELEQFVPENLHVSDLVFLFEPARRFAAGELQAGRLPMWTPHYFAGAPFIWPKFSPLLLPGCLIGSPIVLAWSQLLAALVAGTGAYCFLRRVLGLSFWPSCVAAWCYPLTGFFAFWQGFPTGLAVFWLPWLLLAVDRTVRGAKASCRPGEPQEVCSRNADGKPAHGSRSFLKSRLAPIGLAMVTALMLVSGHLDVAGQVLLVSALYALWVLFDLYARPLFSISRQNSLPTGDPHGIPRGLWRDCSAATLTLVSGWVLGLLLAAPYILPVLDYTRTGARMVRRGAGAEERPPIGLKALPETVLPDMYGGYGAMKRGSYRIARDVQNESAAAAYTGLLATLLVAPLAWLSRRHRWMTLLCVWFVVIGLGWCINLPGVVHLLRLPGLNMMSHNRLVFMASFGILVMGAIGLEVLHRRSLLWCRWLWLPAGLLAGLCAWCAFRALLLPEPIRTGLAGAVLRGQTVGWIHDLDAVRQVQNWFVARYAGGAVLCALGVAGWLLLRWSSAASATRGAAASAGSVARLQGWMFVALALLWPADLLWFGWGRSVQSDPALYYPSMEVLEKVVAAEPGRVIGMHCLPANLAAMAGLDEVRGYDSVDPSRYVELMALAADPRTRKASYAETQRLVPKGELTREGAVRLSPVLDMLGVRYVIFRGAPPPQVRPVFQGSDYWVLANTTALPRAYVPRQVEVVADSKTRLEKLGSPKFNPREVAYLESPVSLPVACVGSAQVVKELPTCIELAVKLDTQGLVVLADRWDVGWQAYLDGRRVPILRANHALRGVVAGAGARRLEFRYEPASFSWGLRLAAFAAIAVVAWLAAPAPLARRMGRLQPKLQT